MKQKEIVDRLYEFIAGDEDARVCKDIPEEACVVVPPNFFLHLASQFLTKIGDALSSPGLVITWLLSVLAAPTALIATLVPLREAGSLLPQMALGGVLRAYPIRKWFWILGSALQGSCVVLMGVVALLSEGWLAGGLVVGLVALFSLSRGICSVSSKDLIGKTVPKTRRGRLSGLAASLAGGVSLAVGVFFAVQPKENLSVGAFVALLVVAGGAWIAAAALMAFLDEKPGATAGGGNALKEALRSLRILRDDPSFRAFCIVRGLLASTVLSMPFYVLLARQATEGMVASLGILMGASSIATLASGWAWGWLADRSSRMTIVVAGLAAGGIGCLTAAVSALEITVTASLWMYGGLFFLLGLAHTGIRLGRKTYLIDMAPQEQRASYVAVSNTLIGIILLASGAVGGLAGFLGPRGIVLLFALLGIAGGLYGLTLRDVEE
jgi:hypothetical protein